MGLDGDFAVEVAMPEHLGRRYVEAATPLGGERLMLGGGEPEAEEQHAAEHQALAI